MRDDSGRRVLARDDKRALRARAHRLRPVVMIGQRGLTEAVMAELNIALEAHELIKISVRLGTREAGLQAVDTICRDLDAACVSRIGRTAVLFRPSA
ncbi:MAG: ribosome assembly RNA-binding protein YhbY [Gammaproteobacteria bacterium]|nr:ribosome assembly RNA-binding protein YhbY [Gammaproteobacteria bacterium]NNM00853.1 ribosome assembly RNA-binding protein YhbY [Gammaproteobacteria bacterium]